MFAALGVAGLTVAIWLFLRGDMFLCAVALAAAGFSAQQFIATRFEP
jgi:hypothetical protein